MAYPMGMNRQFLKFAAFGAPSKLVVRVNNPIISRCARSLQGSGAGNGGRFQSPFDMDDYRSPG